VFCRQYFICFSSSSLRLFFLTAATGWKRQRDDTDNTSTYASAFLTRGIREKFNLTKAPEYGNIIYMCFHDKHGRECDGDEEKTINQLPQRGASFARAFIAIKRLNGNPTVKQ
jgi:hypothetical protein